MYYIIYLPMPLGAKGLSAGINHKRNIMDKNAHILFSITDRANGSRWQANLVNTNSSYAITSYFDVLQCSERPNDAQNFIYCPCTELNLTDFV